MSKIRMRSLSFVLLMGLSMCCTSAWGQSNEGGWPSIKDLPFRGTAAGAVVDQIPPNGLEVQTRGKATHLGKFRRTEFLFLNPDGSFVGQLVFFAANGDQLSADIEGQFISQTEAVGKYYFTGGTGRFSGASGEADFEAITPDGIQVTVVFDGRIRY